MINITSGNLHDSRLVYWVNRRIDVNPIIDELRGLEPGFHRLDKAGRGLGLDYIRSSLLNTVDGRSLPHDVAGQFNDIIDILAPTIQQAIQREADVYIFGSQSPSDAKVQMHNVHMNQGNCRQFCCEDGVFQDGGLIFQFKRPEEWLGIFLAFSSQAVHTHAQTGHAISGVDWRDLLRPDIIEDGVVIKEAYVHPRDSELGGLAAEIKRKAVTLSNRTNHPVSLRRWSIRNAAGEFQTLPMDATIKPRIDQRFDLTACGLSDRGDTLLLLNQDGMKVDAVSYNLQQGRKGGPIVFGH